jgi:MscS family membrane protein
MANEMSTSEVTNTTAGSASTHLLNPVDTFAEHVHQGIQTILENVHNPLTTFILSHPIVFFFAIALVGLVTAYVLVFLSQGVVKAFTRKTKTNLDDILLERLRHPVALSILLLFLSVALVPLSLKNAVADVLTKSIFSLNILLIAVILNRVIGTLINHYGSKIAAQTESAVDDHLIPIVRKIVAVTIYVLAFFAVLGVWGLNIAPLLAGAGIAGIALAFAMQESLKNVFGGVSLAFDRAYAVGDRIKIADGTVGTVTDITLRSTKIRTFDGDLIVVPNGKIANENFQTYAQPTHETRVLVPFSVAYGNDIEHVKEVVTKALKGAVGDQIEKTQHDMATSVEFLEMGAYSLNFRAIVWVADYRNSWDAKLLANRLVYDALRKAKIEIPYPRQVIELRKEA